MNRHCNAGPARQSRRIRGPVCGARFARNRIFANDPAAASRGRRPRTGNVSGASSLPPYIRAGGAPCARGCSGSRTTYRSATAGRSIGARATKRNGRRSRALPRLRAHRPEWTCSSSIGCSTSYLRPCARPGCYITCTAWTSRELAGLGHFGRRSGGSGLWDRLSDVGGAIVSAGLTVISFQAVRRELRRLQEARKHASPTAVLAIV
jgi:hypothetical protein